MRKHLRAAAVMVGMAAGGGAWAAPDESAEPERAALPAPIAARVRAAFPEGTIAETSRRRDGWEATLVSGLRRREIVLDPAGNVVEHRVPVGVAELPEEVRDALARSHPRHTIWRAARVETGAGVFHEVLLSRGDRRAAVVFDPDHRVVAGVTRVDEARKVGIGSRRA